MTMQQNQTSHSIHHNPTSISTLPVEFFPPTNPSHGQVTWQTLFSTPSSQQQQPSSLCAGIAICPPRTGNLALHRHSQAEIYHVISGTGVVVVEGKAYDVEAGSVVSIPGDAEHGVWNKGDAELRWLYVFPTARFEDVVYRFS